MTDAPSFRIWPPVARMMATHRTALLPGGATRVVLDRGPFGLSRNPLYVGLIVFDIACETWAVNGTIPFG